MDSIRDVRRLQVEPGDVLIVSTHKRLARGELVDLKDLLEDEFPGNDVVILNDCELTVAREVV